MSFLMLDIASVALNAEDKEILQHPSVGGLILFKRNYESVSQVTSLIQSIRKIRSDQFLIAVDQEGGRVQRFIDGFVRLPSLGSIGELPIAQARTVADAAGWIMASELLAVGVDISFAPVLDVNNKISRVIADRSFHSDTNIIIDLARSMITGMQRAGMAATGKHFPGHGSIAADSHVEIPIDDRDYNSIFNYDLQPFKELQHDLKGIMPAHVIYRQVDDRPAGFSPFWLQEVLRKRIGFQGAIFSDDLGMAGASGFGNFADRAQCALAAGCDMVLVCNDRQGAIEVIDGLPQKIHKDSKQRISAMCVAKHLDWKTLHESSTWHTNLRSLGTAKVNL